jgi:hypothetical protein
LTFSTIITGSSYISQTLQIHASAHGLPETSETEGERITLDFISTVIARQKNISGEKAPKKKAQSCPASFF